jgi:AcrR family transcriptional regulator
VQERTERRQSAREQLVGAAIEHLSVHGPAGLQPQDICRELGMSKALVNYHFGGREGLIAEAMVVAYEAYVVELMTAADAAGPEPVDRLMGWIDGQVAWTSDHRGLAAALDFPDVALGRQPLSMTPVLSDRLAVAGARNFANLQLLVLDARSHLLRDREGWQADATEVGLTSAVIGWITLGLSVWVGGNHLPTRQPSLRSFLPVAREHVRTLVVEMLRR